MTVLLTGANSPADLASTNIRYLFLDEVDKFPGASKKEADPVSLARAHKNLFQPQNLYGLHPHPENGPYLESKRGGGG